MKSDFFPPAPDLLGNLAPRWPTQAIGTIASLLIVLVIWMVLERKAAPGTTAALALTLIAAVNFALAFVRADPISLARGVRLDIVASGTVLGLGIVGLTVLKLRRTEG